MQIQVAMITYNGVPHLSAQLDSLLAQTLQPNALWVSDDGSTDATVETLQDFRRRAPFDVHILQGPRQGAAANMISLFQSLPDVAVATCDQDDIWFPTKLSNAAKHLSRFSSDACVLHVAARRPNASRRGASTARHKLSNAFVENRAPGNATTFSSRATAILAETARETSGLPPFFDWWAYQVVLAMGGTVVEDPHQGLFYRSHRNNILGPRGGARGVSKRIKALSDGTFMSWVFQNARLLETLAPKMGDQDKADLRDLLANAPDGVLPRQFKRRSWVENFCLRAALAMPFNR